MGQAPMSFQEFLAGRVCKGDQARQDYEDYVRDFEKDEEDDNDVC